MASRQPGTPSNWLDLVLKRRKELILYGFTGIAALGATLGALAFVLVKVQRRGQVYSKTAEIACLLRYVSEDSDTNAGPDYRFA
jgi:hypothetical protein